MNLKIYDKNNSQYIVKNKGEIFIIKDDNLKTFSVRIQKSTLFVKKTQIYSQSSNLYLFNKSYWKTRCFHNDKESEHPFSQNVSKSTGPNKNVNQIQKHSNYLRTCIQEFYTARIEVIRCSFMKRLYHSIFRLFFSAATMHCVRRSRMNY
jgi:flagellar basal body P-ring protein FlgI